LNKAPHERPPLPLRKLDLNLLKVFDVVMVERNVTRAAGRLAMTQPAVSNACAACAKPPSKSSSCRMPAA
jgi:hypothetical protein